MCPDILLRAQVLFLFYFLVKKIQKRKSQMQSDFVEWIHQGSHFWELVPDRGYCNEFAKACCVLGYWKWLCRVIYWGSDFLFFLRIGAWQRVLQRVRAGVLRTLPRDWTRRHTKPPPPPPSSQYSTEGLLRPRLRVLPWAFYYYYFRFGVR